MKSILAEHKQFQKVISTLERDVADLKKEISERDGTIQDKEKRIYELKRKKQELEKYKFVLNFKITELKNQVSHLSLKIKVLLRIISFRFRLQCLTWILSIDWTQRKDYKRVESADRRYGKRGIKIIECKTWPRYDSSHNFGIVNAECRLR